MRRRIFRCIATLFDVVLVAASVVLAVYSYERISSAEVLALWSFRPHALQLYTEPADARYCKAWLQVCEHARKLGFRFPDSTVVQTKDILNIWRHRWSMSGGMAVNPDTVRMVLVDTAYGRLMTDDDLECALSHELGHMVDASMRRRGHPLFDRIWCLDTEQFADEVGRYLCGRKRYDRMLRMYVNFRPLVPETCRNTTLVH